MIKTIIVLGSANTDMVAKSSRLPAPGKAILGGVAALWDVFVWKEFKGSQNVSVLLAAVSCCFKEGLGLIIYAVFK